MAFERLHSAGDITGDRELGDPPMLLGHVAGLIGDELAGPMDEEFGAGTQIRRDLRQGLTPSTGEDGGMKRPVSAIPLPR